MLTNTIFLNILSMSLAASFALSMILFARKILDKKVSISKLNLLWIIFMLTLIVPINFSSKISIKNFAGTEDSMILLNIKNTYDSIGKMDGDEISEVMNQDVKSLDALGIETEEIIRTLSYVWTFGAFLLICKDVIIYSSISKFKDYNLNKNLNRILQAQKQKLNIKKDIKILIQDKIKTPSLYGIIYVNILIPLDVLSLNEDEIEMIILHELMHYKKFHHVKYLFLRLLEDLHWFNPLIKYAGRFIREDMECIVDSAIVAQKYDRVKYSKTILKLLDCGNYANTEMNLLPGICEDRNSLERRIDNMKNNAGNTKHAIILLAVAMALISLFTISFASEKLENKEMEITEKEIVNLSENSLEKVVTLVKPLKEIKITATFGERVHPIRGDKMFHSGLDMKANEGDEIYAVMDGTVVFTNYETERGNTIRIKHKDGTSSTYAHGLEFLVEPGDEVKAGQAIMKVGATGMATGPHLHFEMENADGELIDINGIFE